MASQFCQCEDCMADAVVYVCGSAGWWAIHCEVCTANLISSMLPSVIGGTEVIVVLPFTIGGWEAVNHILSLAGVEGING